MMVTPLRNLPVKFGVLLRKFPLPGSTTGAAYAPLLPVVLLVSLVGSVVGGLLLTEHSGTPADWSIYVASSADGIAKFDARTHALQWTTQANGSITISQQVIYASNGSVLRALNAGDGSLRWSCMIASPGAITTLPVVSDGAVYIATTLGGGSIYALSAASGRLLWHTFLAAETNLTATNGMLYVSTDFSFTGPSLTNDLYALDAKTGRALWHLRAPAGEVFGSPQMADGTLFLVSSIPDEGGSVYALTPRTGAERWHSRAVAGLFSTAPPVAAEGRIYFAPTNTGSLYALDAATGAEVWHYQGAFEGEEFHVPPVVSNGVAYYWGKSDRQHRNFVLALAASTGTVLWRYWGLYLHDALAVQEGGVYVSSKDGILHALRAADGTELWQEPYIRGATPSTRVVVDLAMVVVAF